MRLRRQRGGKAMVLEQVLTLLREHGYKITPQRSSIAAAVLDSQAPCTAGEILQAVQVDHPDISLDTVYRNLGLLRRLGVVAAIDGIGRDGVRFEVVRHHHHHITCLRCGRSECVDVCPIDERCLQVMRNKGYDHIQHQVAFFGVCQECRQETGDKS